MENLIKIGYTQKPHGLSGELKVFIEDTYEEDFMECETVFLNIKGKELPFFIESIRGGNFTIVKFEDVDTKEKAMEIQSKGLSIRATDLIPDQAREVQLISESGKLIGYMILDKTAGEVGIIQEVLEMPQQEMFSLKYQKRDILIPVSDDYILEIDDDKKEILMDLPDGLLDL